MVGLLAIPFDRPALSRLSSLDDVLQYGVLHGSLTSNTIKGVSSTLRPGQVSFASDVG
jgi:hypothetical protein